MMTYPLIVDHVTKQYGEKTAVNDIQLRVKQGEIYGLLGANGAGKTTTMRMVLGLIYPDQGSKCGMGKAIGKSCATDGLFAGGARPVSEGESERTNYYLAELRGLTRKQADARFENVVGAI